MTDEAAMPLAGGGPQRIPTRTPGPVLALDLGGTQIRAGAVAPGGRLLSRTGASTPLAGGPEAVLAIGRRLLEEARDRLPRRDREALVGLGISAPGPLDLAAGSLVDPPNLGAAFHGMSVRDPLGEATGLAAFIERDTHVAALGEGAFGAARGVEDYIYLTVSTGIGGAVVTGGRLLGGPDGVAGELGHMPVDVDGPLCGCGARGHLEAISSGSGIARAATEAVAQARAGGPGTELLTVARRLDPEPLQAVHVAVAEEAGDAVAAAIMERARTAFAAAIVGMVDIFDPTRIIVGGGVAQNQGERWLQPAREAVAATAFRIPARRVRIVPPDLGEDVSLIGAVPLVAAGLARAGLEPAPANEPDESGAPGLTSTTSALRADALPAA
jgi:glucokinase